MARLNGNPIPKDDHGWSEIRRENGIAGDRENGIAGELTVERGDYLTLSDCYAADLNVALPDGESHVRIVDCFFTGRLQVRQPWTGSDLTIASCWLDQLSPIVEVEDPPRLYGWLMRHRLYGRRWRRGYASIWLKAPTPSRTVIIGCVNKATL